MTKHSVLNRMAYRSGHVGVCALLEEGQGVPVGPEARGKVQRAVAAVLLDHQRERGERTDKDSERKGASETCNRGRWGTSWSTHRQPHTSRYRRD